MSVYVCMCIQTHTLHVKSICICTHKFLGFFFFSPSRMLLSHPVLLLWILICNIFPLTFSSLSLVISSTSFNSSHVTFNLHLCLRSLVMVSHTFYLKVAFYSTSLLISSDLLAQLNCRLASGVPFSEKQKVSFSSASAREDYY